MLCCHDNLLRYKVQSPNQIHKRQIEQNELLCIRYIYPKIILKFGSKKKESTYSKTNTLLTYLPTYLACSI